MNLQFKGRNLVVLIGCMVIAIFVWLEFKGCQHVAKKAIQSDSTKEEKAIAVIVKKETPIKSRQDTLKKEGANISKKSKALPDVKKVAEKVRLNKPDSSQFEKFDSSIVDSVIRLAETKEFLLKEANRINSELSGTIDSLRVTESEKEVLNKSLIAGLRSKKDSLQTELDKKKGLGWKRFKQGVVVGAGVVTVGFLILMKP